MGRIRTIKPEFFTHSALFDAELETKMPLRVAYAGLWTCCDREGRFKWRPRELKLAILPYDDLDFSRVLDALTTRGFVVKYALEGEFFGVVPSFSKHQVINNRESESSLPNPNDCNKIDACPTRESRDDDATATPLKGKGREGKEYSRVNDAMVERVYQAYPRHVGRNAALKAIEKVLKQGHDFDWLMDRVERYASIRAKEDQQFTPHPATWFNEGRYFDDELAPPTNGKLTFVRDDGSPVVPQ